jgi:ketopantoate reductase
MAARAVAVIGPGALGLLYASRLSKVVPTAAAIRLAARMKPKGVLSLQNGLIEKIPQGVTTAGAYRDGKKVVPVALGKTLLFRIRNGEIRKRPYRAWPRLSRARPLWFFPGKGWKSRLPRR